MAPCDKSLSCPLAELSPRVCRTHLDERRRHGLNGRLYDLSGHVVDLARLADDAFLVDDGVEHPNLFLPIPRLEGVEVQDNFAICNVLVDIRIPVAPS